MLIPIKKIKNIYESANLNKPEQKYMEIVTVDDFEFWFMGFLRYNKAYKNLRKAISMANENVNNSDISWRQQAQGVSFDCQFCVKISYSISYALVFVHTSEVMKDLMGISQVEG